MCSYSCSPKTLGGTGVVFRCFSLLFVVDFFLPFVDFFFACGFQSLSHSNKASACMVEVMTLSFLFVPPYHLALALRAQLPRQHLFNRRNLIYRCCMS